MAAAVFTVFSTPGCRDPVDALSPRVAPSRSMALINDSTIVVARVLIATAFFSAGNGEENSERP
jgi:hypothetical protein